MGVYQQGFISVTNSSNIVIGKGTRFLNFVHPGDQLSFVLQSTPVTVEIESVDSHQQLTLTTELFWTGDVDPWLTYSIELLPFQEKQNCFAKRVAEFQQTINQMERMPIESLKSDDAEASAWYFATDEWREKYKNPEGFAPGGMDEVIFFGADNYQHFVGTGWFAESFSVYPSILRRDSLLQVQLNAAIADLLVLLNGIEYTEQDIINYTASFIMPVYPYA